MTMISEQIHFGSTPQHKVVLQRQVGAPHGNFGAGVRQFRMFIYNDSDVDITVTLDGSEVDSGYGLDWTNRASVTVGKRSKDILEGAVRGKEEHWRIAVQSSAGDGEGRIEIIDASDNYKR